MEKISNIEKINESIERSDLFELRFNKDYPELTESINSISFSKEMNMIYLTVTNFGELIRPDKDGQLKVHNYDLDLNNLNTVISEGINLILCDRSGNIKYNFELGGCVLEDIAEQKLDYNLDHKFKTYIISISYEQIIKILKV